MTIEIRKLIKHWKAIEFSTSEYIGAKSQPYEVTKKVEELQYRESENSEWKPVSVVKEHISAKDEYYCDTCNRTHLKSELCPISKALSEAAGKIVKKGRLK